MQEIRVFLDSNVILSGLLTPQGNPRVLLDLLSICVPHLVGLTGAYNVEEIERNLNKKFPQLLAVYQSYFPKINLTVIPLPDLKKLKPYFGKMSDKDIPVLVAAKLGGADCLITGNKKDFPKKLVDPMLLMNPKEFLDYLGTRINQ